MHLQTKTAGIKQCAQASESVHARASNGFEAWLHRISGILLLGFAVSHFAFLTMKDISGPLPNVVFLYITNKTVYLIAGLFELSVGFICLRWSGQDAVNVMVLAFVGIVSIYRWAFYSMGGITCTCLGLLGKLFHVTKQQEKCLPIIAVMILISTTVPWIVRSIGKITGRSLVLFVLCLIFQREASGQVVEIHGTYDSAEYNPKSGAPNQNTVQSAEFTATISKEGWKIFARNKRNPASWSEVIYDGTNTYTRIPYQDGNFIKPSQESNLVFCTISHSPLYLGVVDDRMRIFIPWITYGLSPQKVQPTKSGKLEIPLPWAVPHIFLTAYGFNWLIQATPDRRFIENCEVIRDVSLDLSEKDEFYSRPELDYPSTVSALNVYRETLDYRKAITNDFVKARYTCSGWCFTNNTKVPMISELQYYVPPFTNSVFRAKLRASTVAVRDEEGALLPQIDSPMMVYDYRYKRANSTRIFKFAEYTLNPGDIWRPDNDPELLAQAASHLRWGERIDEYAYRKNLFVWLLMAVILAWPITMFFRLRYKRGKHNG